MDIVMDMDYSIDMGMQHGDGHVACIRHVQVCIHIRFVSSAMFTSDHFCFASIRFYPICFVSICFYSLHIIFVSLLFTSIRFLSYSFRFYLLHIIFDSHHKFSNSLRSEYKQI
jgi:hypothetical protein